jgi:hypothetical protein
LGGEVSFELSLRHTAKRGMPFPVIQSEILLRDDKRNPCDVVYKDTEVRFILVPDCPENQQK